MKVFDYIHIIVPEITDSDLKPLSDIPDLVWLDLTGTITDDGLKYLAGLANLETLIVNSTQVTYQGMRALEKALPNCDVRQH